MGVTCEILIKKPREGVHKAGGPVTGVIRYALDKPTKYKEILLALIGQGVCTWKESQKDSEGNYKTVRYTGTENYTSQSISLYKEGPTFVLPSGVYDYPFSFSLPLNIPPTYQNDVCSIKYNLVMIFRKPNFFKSPKTFDAEITVHSYVNPTSPPGNTFFELEKTLFKPFSRKTHQINLKTGIPSTILKPGQNADITYEITNDTNVTIPSIKTELLCYTTYTARCGRRKNTALKYPACKVETPSIPDNGIANMTNTMPILTDLQTIQNCTIMVNEFRVKVTVKLPIPYINASTEMSVVLGEMYGAFDVDAAVEVCEDEPPSYFEAMTENLEEKYMSEIAFADK